MRMLEQSRSFHISNHRDFVLKIATRLRASLQRGRQEKNTSFKQDNHQTHTRTHTGLNEWDLSARNELLKGSERFGMVCRPLIIWIYGGESWQSEYASLSLSVSFCFISLVSFAPHCFLYLVVNEGFSYSHCLYYVKSVKVRKRN